MPRLSHAQAAVRHEIVQLVGSNLLPEQLGDRILQSLRLAIPADAAALFGIDPDSLLFNRLIAASIGGIDPAMTWLRDVYLLHEPAPELTFISQMRMRLNAIAFYDRVDQCYAPPELFAGYSPHEWYRVYHDIGSPTGGGLRACFAADGQWIAALQMGRFEAGHPFQPTDVQFLRLLAPAIGHALRRALARERALAVMEADPEAAGVLVLTSEGHVLLQTAAAEAWLKLLRDTRHAVMPSTTSTPTAVWSAIAKLRSSVEDATYAALRVPIPSGMLRVEVSPFGDDHAIAVVLVPERSPPPELPKSWPLTPGERNVLSVVACGLSNRQIAATLTVSENTVESHLAHAYEKLGVSSRTQFLARLFQEVYWSMVKHSTTTASSK